MGVSTAGTSQHKPRRRSTPAVVERDPDRSRRTGGRTALHTARITAATMDLLIHGGIDAVSFQAVAERAGVSRATMYRRWPTPAHLAIEAIRATAAGAVAIPDTGSLIGDLRAVLRDIATFTATRIGRSAMIAGLHLIDRGAEDDANSWQRRWDDVQPVFDRAIGRGELPTGSDTEALFAALAGALYFRVIVTGGPVDDEWIERALRIVATSTQPGPDGRSASDAEPHPRSSPRSGPTTPSHATA